MIQIFQLFKATLVLLSIGLYSNLDNKTRYYERASSQPKDGYQIVKDFMDNLFELCEKFQESLPREIMREYESLQEIIQNILHI